ncbi:MAG TPA: ATP-binding cassette domain-containing protein, partial [Actinomycetota bacterium]|nr:ATP-binding cassette domain-containing protein [Actinomycetota bacterium]
MSDQAANREQAAAVPTTVARGEPILTLQDLHASYGPVHVLQGITVEIRRGEIVCLLGSNAAGKTTTLRTILAMVRAQSGDIIFDGEKIDHLTTTEIVSRGLTMVPENRRLFGR